MSDGSDEHRTPPESVAPKPATGPRWRSWMVVAGAVLLGFAVFVGMRPMPAAVDTVFHVYFAHEFAESLAEELTWPDWDAFPYGGRGTAAFRYYAPLAYLVATGWQWLGVATPTALKWTTLVFSAIGACGIWCWFGRLGLIRRRWLGLVLWFGSPITAGLLFRVFFWQNLLAAMWLPWLWGWLVESPCGMRETIADGCGRLTWPRGSATPAGGALAACDPPTVEADWRDTAKAGVTLALVGWTHLPTALMAGYLVTVVVVIQALRDGRLIRAVGRLSAIGIIAAGMVAPYALPAMAELDQLHFRDNIGHRAAWHQQQFLDDPLTGTSPTGAGQMAAHVGGSDGPTASASNPTAFETTSKPAPEGDPGPAAGSSLLHPGIRARFRLVATVIVLALLAMAVDRLLSRRRPSSGSGSPFAGVPPTATSRPTRAPSGGHGSPPTGCPAPQATGGAQLPFLLAGIASLALLWRGSLPVWQLLPGLYSLQYPWRWLLPAGSLLLPMLASRRTSRPGRWLTGAAVAGWLGITVLIQVHATPFPATAVAGAYAVEFHYPCEYTPRQCQRTQCHLTDPIPPDGGPYHRFWTGQPATFGVTLCTRNRFAAMVELATDTSITSQTHFDPNWEVIDATHRRVVEVSATGSCGHLHFTLPAGCQAFTMTRVGGRWRTLGWLWFALTGIGILLAWHRRSPADVEPGPANQETSGPNAVDAHPAMEGLATIAGQADPIDPGGSSTGRQSEPAPSGEVSRIVLSPRPSTVRTPTPSDRLESQPEPGGSYPDPHDAGSAPLPPWMAARNASFAQCNGALPQPSPTMGDCAPLPPRWRRETPVSRSATGPAPGTSSHPPIDAAVTGSRSADDHREHGSEGPVSPPESAFQPGHDDTRDRTCWPWWVVGGFCLITTTVYLGHFLWPGAPVPGHPSGDLPLQFWPMRALVARRLTAGGFPAWNPHIYCGTPLLANFVSGVFYPPNLLFAWLSPANAVRAYWAIHLVAAQLFSWLWLRRTVGGTGFPLAGAVLIVFSGPWLSHLHAGHLNSVAAMTWMPLIGWLVLRCLDAGATAASAVRADAGNATAPGSAPKASKQGRPTAPADLAVSGPGLAGALMLQIFAGQPQYVYFTLCAILVGLGWRLVRPPPPERRDWAGPARVLGWLGVGLLLAGVQIGPGLAFAAVSARSAASAAWSGGFSLPASHLVTLVLPDFFGSLTGLSYHGEWYQWETNSYVGLFMGWLFLLALADRRGWPATLPAIAATVGVVVLALGDQTPVHGWLVRLGTGLRWFRGPAKWLALLPPLLAVAAGRAFAVHFDGGSAQTGPIGSTSQGGPVARSFAATPGRQSDRSERHQPLPGQSELTTERIVPSNHPACSSRAAGDAHTSSTPAAWRPARLSRCPLLTAAAMLAGIAALWLWRGDDAHAVARALAMTTSPAFLAEAAPIRDPAFGQHLGHAHQEQFAGLATQGGVLLLLVILGAFDPQRRQSIGRLMLALAVIDQLRFARHDRPACHPLPPLPAAVTATIARVPHHPRVVYVGLPANRAMLDGTQTPGGHDALMLSHASEYLHHSQGLPASASRLGFAIDRFGPLTDLAGVALTVIGPGVEGQHPDWIRVHDHGDVRCDLNRRAVPRAFVVRRVVAIDDATTALHWLADPARAAMACAVVASAAGVEDLLHDPAHDAGSGQAVPAPLPVFIRDEPESVELEVQAGQPGLLVLQDAWAPGWHATVDGRVTPVLRVNHAFRGVRLDAGPHRVHFAYQPPGLAAGLAATFLGLSLTIWRLALRFRRYSKQQGYQGR